MDGVENVRQLEDLIIEAIYRGLLGGKLDQKHQAVRLPLSHPLGEVVRGMCWHYLVLGAGFVGRPLAETLSC